jgi:hypothetical protein
MEEEKVDGCFKLNFFCCQQYLTYHTSTPLNLEAGLDGYSRKAKNK